MAILTLTPSRFAAATDLLAGSHAYAVATQPVRKLGQLVTPQALVVEVENDGDTITFDLEPNSLVDDAEEFFYSVALYDPDNCLIYRYDIVMPTTATNIFDLIPVPQDLDSCVTTTHEDNS